MNSDQMQIELISGYQDVHEMIGASHADLRSLRLDVYYLQSPNVDSIQGEGRKNMKLMNQILVA